jgi:hypothetical protein
MQYISPLSFLGGGAIAADKKSIQLAKKKMLAEVELSATGSILVNGRELTKNDIIVFFDSLQTDDSLPYHVAIADDPALLYFLEHNTLGRNSRFKICPLFEDSQFVEWLSPYFFTSFATLAKKCLKERDDDAWAALFANAILMNFYYTEEAWKEIEKAVQADWEKIDRFQKKKVMQGLQAVEPLLNFKYISMLKRLPVGRFNSLLDGYAFTVMQCSIHIFNRVSRNRGLVVVENALILVASPYVRKTILDKKFEMEGIHGRVIEKNTKLTNRRIVIFAVIVGIFFFAGLIGEFSDDDNKPKEYNNSMEYLPKDTLPTTDSIGGLQKLSTGKDSANLRGAEPPSPQQMFSDSSTIKARIERQVPKTK